MDLQNMLFSFLNIIVTGINIMGIIIIIWGFLVAATGFISIKIHRHSSDSFITDANKIRVILGTYILMGLEFMIAADIVHTFIQPSQEDLLILATIVGIRTVISYFLDRSVQEAESHKNKPKIKQ